MRPQDYGLRNWSEADMAAEVERIRAADEKRARDRRGFERLCGIAAPIGRAVDL